MKKLLKFISIFTILLLTGILLSNYYITSNAKGKTFNSTQNIPNNKVGVLLGANKYVSGGRINLYYKYRINAAVALYKSGKIDFILVSGDNGSKYYDEPSTFKDDLIKKGVPEEKIYLDYAGFRTLDSMVRAKEIFGQQSITIISQKFHNERAIYLAESHDIKAVAYNAKDVKGRNGLRTDLREYLARTKAVFDIIFGVQPKFYGDQIIIQ